MSIKGDRYARQSENRLPSSKWLKYFIVHSWPNIDNMQRIIQIRRKLRDIQSLILAYDGGYFDDLFSTMMVHGTKLCTNVPNLKLERLKLSIVVSRLEESSFLSFFFCFFGGESGGDFNFEKKKLKESRLVLIKHECLRIFSYS